jgi:hypothetical protein
VAARTMQHRSPLPSLAGWWRAARSWGYEGGKRDLRFDLLRGFAVFAMVVDHVGGDSSPLYVITGGNRFFASAAEAFVFLSGLLMGMINGGLIRRGDVGEALRRVIRRATLLYSITVGMTLLIAVLPNLLRLAWAPDLGGEPLLDYVVGVFTLHRTTYLIDVMLLYTLLVLAAEPILLLLEHGRTRLVLGGSWLLWFLWQGWPAAADIWPIPGEELFVVSAWQVLFVTALVIGYHRRKLEGAFRAAGSLPALLISGAALAGLLALYFSRLAPLIALTGRDRVTLDEWFFAKDDVAPGRIVTFAAAIVFAYALATLAWRPLARATGWLLLPLGQNALSAYIIHLFVVGLFDPLYFVLLGPAAHPVAVALFQLAAVLAVWGVIQLRPKMASSLERLESVRAMPLAAGATTLTLETAVPIDAQLAHAEARQGIDTLR